MVAKRPLMLSILLGVEETIEDRIIHQEEIEEMGNSILRLPK